MRPRSAEQRSGLSYLRPSAFCFSVCLLSSMSSQQQRFYQRMKKRLWILHNSNMHFSRMFMWWSSLASGSLWFSSKTVHGALLDSTIWLPAGPSKYVCYLQASGIISQNSTSTPSMSGKRFLLIMSTYSSQTSEPVRYWYPSVWFWENAVFSNYG